MFFHTIATDGWPELGNANHAALRRVTGPFLGSTTVPPNIRCRMTRMRWAKAAEASAAASSNGTFIRSTQT